VSKIKNAKAQEFLGRAAVLEADLADETKQFTLDEVNARVEEIKALKTRAVMVSEVVETGLEQRAAEGHITLPSPEATAEVQGDQAEFGAISQRVGKAFGSAGRYILALARRTAPEAKPWSAAQKEAHAALRSFQQRVMVGTGSDASGGEFLLPLTQTPDIFVGANIVQPGLFERAPRYACPGRSVRIPYLIQTDATNDTRPLSGIAATAIEAEGGEKDEREPSIGQRVVTAYKWAAYTEVADELLEDDYTGQLTSVLQRAVGGDLLNSINLSITSGGTGSSQPLGALHTNNGALITINRTTSMNITTDDVLAMLAKSTMGPRTFWLAHVSTMPEILGLQLASGSQVTFLQNLNGAPSAMLLGYPIVWTHLVSKLGVAGDLALIDPDHYATVMRREVTMESSIHYKFRNDITAYRFFARAGGLPIPTSEYSFAAAGGTATYEFSPFVRLGDDATS